MLHVSIDSHSESLFGTFHKVTSAAAMNMHLNTTRYNNTPLGIDDFGIFNV